LFFYPTVLVSQTPKLRVSQKASDQPSDQRSEASDVGSSAELKDVSNKLSFENFGLGDVGSDWRTADILVSEHNSQYPSGWNTLVDDNPYAPKGSNWRQGMNSQTVVLRELSTLVKERGIEHEVCAFDV
jgi:hypothetical protein